MGQRLEAIVVCISTLRLNTAAPVLKRGRGLEKFTYPSVNLMP